MENRYKNTACTNLQEVLDDAVLQGADKYIGFVHGDGSLDRLTYSELYTEATNILIKLQKHGIKRGDYIILCTDTNYDTVVHLWACILGGIVPTVLQPPVSFTSHNISADKLLMVNRLLENPYIIFGKEIKNPDPVQFDPRKIIAINYSKEPGRAEIFYSDGNDIAYVQFSSGSTGDPKGVILTHNNIITNADSISKGLCFNHDDVTVNWMPLYHDMGLIGYHITPLYYTYNQYHIETIDFIKDPFLWLTTMTKYKATITGCPNFGQALINRHMTRKNPTDIDLSSVKALLNGAEPISPEIMEKFMANLEPYGFKKSSMMPVYGMAEATLAISFFPIGNEPEVKAFKQESLSKYGTAIVYDGTHEPVQRIVNVGKPLKDILIKISNDSGETQPEGVLGEVMVKGDNVSQGYFRDLKKGSKKRGDGWLPTGDQGFILSGHLYITGRYKDIIFINGINFYSHDLESFAIRECDLAYGKFVIGGYFNEKKGHDSIIAFLAGSDNEHTRDKLKKITGLYHDTLGLQIDHYVLVRSNQIHKTSSGKLKRYQMVKNFLDGELKEIVL